MASLAGSSGCSKTAQNRSEGKIPGLNIEYFAAFIRELRKTTQVAGCHIMAVGFEEIVKEIIAASSLKS